METKNFEKMKDVELLRIIKDPEVKKIDYDRAMATLWVRYQPQIHNNWWKLQRQMNNINAVNLLKDDFYSEASEVFINAINHIDLSRVENDKFKCVGMLNWYLTNLRKKLIQKIIKAPMTKSIDYMNNIDDESNKIDSDVEESYWISEGYQEEPSYVLERKDEIGYYEKAINYCKKIWGSTERIVFNGYMLGLSRSEIAEKMNISAATVTRSLNKIKKDLKNRIKKEY